MFVNMSKCLANTCVPAKVHDTKDTYGTVIKRPGLLMACIKFVFFIASYKVWFCCVFVLKVLS